MATFTAIKNGPLDDGDTFGNTSPGVKGTDWPNETDDVDAAGYALTQGTATGVGSLTDLVTGGGTLTLTGSFTCADVQEVKIIVPNGVTSTISFGTSGVDPGCQSSTTDYAIRNFGTVTNVAGDLTNNGTGACLNLGGTWLDFSGTLTTSGSYGVVNITGGAWTDFSGTLINTGSGDGAYNEATWSDFSGTLTNTGSGRGVISGGTGGTWTDFSGTLTNTSSGVGVYNNRTWTDFSGNLTNSGSGFGVYNDGGTWSDFSGEAVNSGAGTLWDGTLPVALTGVLAAKLPTNLEAANVLTGKTILSVAGSDIGAVAGAAAQLAVDIAEVNTHTAEIKKDAVVLTGADAGTYPAFIGSFQI